MKTKLEMAHEWAMKHGNAETVGSRQNMVKHAWDYADAMQAEADKRNKAEAEQKRKAIREMFNADNTFLEKEGQHFDDVADIQKPYSSSEEWQPDWSQAPECDVVAWDINKHGQGRWIASDNGYYLAPSFGYTGDWRNSLRKRPQ